MNILEKREFTMLIWIFVMTVIGMFMFWYGTSMLKIEIIQKFGYDIIESVGIIIVFVSFLYILAPASNFTRIRNTIGILFSVLSFGSIGIGEFKNVVFFALVALIAWSPEAIKKINKGA